jgi:hypothetical protein
MAAHIRLTFGANPMCHVSPTGSGAPRCLPAGRSPRGHWTLRHRILRPPATRTALHSAALHCTALHCTALHSAALHCTALHSPHVQLPLSNDSAKLYGRLSNEEAEEAVYGGKVRTGQLEPLIQGTSRTLL